MSEEDQGGDDRDLGEILFGEREREVHEYGVYRNEGDALRFLATAEEEYPVKAIEKVYDEL